MKITLNEISKLINGNLIGDPDLVINKICSIQNSCENSLSFVSEKKYLKYIIESKSSAFIVDSKIFPNKKLNTNIILVKNSQLSLINLINVIFKKQIKIGIEKFAHIENSSILGKNIYVGNFTNIEKNVKIGENSQINSNCFIGENTKIGKNCIIYPGAKIYDNSIIEDNCIIHSGSIIGSDGFGFTKNEKHIFKKIPQIGNVHIKSNVEIGSNTCIDRGTFGSTIIEKGVKLDNLIQIGHNVHIGENTVIAGNSGIAGSTKIGSNCMIGGKVAIADHLFIANKTIISGNSGVGKSIKKVGTIIQGPIAFNIKEFQRSYILFKKFPLWINRIKELEKKIFNNGLPTYY